MCRRLGRSWGWGKGFLRDDANEIAGDGVPPASSLRMLSTVSNSFVGQADRLHRPVHRARQHENTCRTAKVNPLYGFCGHGDCTPRSHNFDKFLPHLSHDSVYRLVQFDSHRYNISFVSPFYSDTATLAVSNLWTLWDDQSGSSE